MFNQKTSGTGRKTTSALWLLEFDGLILHTLFYADEVRNPDDIDKPAVKLSDEEIEMGVQLIEQESTDELELEKYKDEYRLRVLELVDAKVKGQEVEVAPVLEPRGQVIDLWRR